MILLPSGTRNVIELDDPERDERVRLVAMLAGEDVEARECDRISPLGRRLEGDEPCACWALGW